MISGFRHDDIIYNCSINYLEIYNEVSYKSACTLRSIYSRGLCKLKPVLIDAGTSIVPGPAASSDPVRTLNVKLVDVPTGSDKTAEFIILYHCTFVFKSTYSMLITRR